MGLIEAIGDWVVEELSRQDALWRADGLSLEISFNLSPRQLWQPDVVDKVISRLRPAGMDPARLTVEITESTAMTDPERTQAILDDMHARGLHLAIDDSGPATRRWHACSEMPFDVLKIDRSFIRDVDTDRDSASMVSAMIALAQNLGMTALAEGIETKDEWEWLVDRGCALGQGYYFSRPIPAAEILALHRRAALTVVEGGAGPDRTPRRQRRFGRRSPERRPRLDPLNTSRAGATFIPSSSNSSCRSRRAAILLTSPC